MGHDAYSNIERKTSNLLRALRFTYCDSNRASETKIRIKSSQKLTNTQICKYRKIRVREEKYYDIKFKTNRMVKDCRCYCCCLWIPKRN